MVIAYDPTRSALYTPETQDTVFETGLAVSSLQLAVEGARLAYYRAEESPAQMKRLGDALGQVGFALPKMFVDIASGAAGFGCLRAGTALIGLRGTQPDDISDIAHDLEATLIDWPESGGHVHAGFASATRALLPAIRQWLNDNNVASENLIVTGHSLGAAMATLVASVFKPAWLVALGSPRVGDQAFIDTVEVANTRRIVDCCDVVTRLPPPVGGYIHLPSCVYITRTGPVMPDPAQSLIDEDRLEAREEYLIDYAWKRGAVSVRDLADHAPINYVRAFFA
jgi:hypothetical protein